MTVEFDSDQSNRVTIWASFIVVMRRQLAIPTETVQATGDPVR